MWWYVALCGGMWWYVVWYVVVCGGMWWYVAVCGGMWRYVLVCGGMCFKVSPDERSQKLWFLVTETYVSSPLLLPVWAIFS